MLNPNTLYRYRGGGYDGCIWEWNYAYVSAGGMFHSLYHSGASGCDSSLKLEELIRTDPDDVMSYDLSDNCAIEKDMEHSWEAACSLRVARWLNRNTRNDDIELTCSRCGKKHDPEDMQETPGDYAGDGGIGINYFSFICNDCYCSNSCAYCGEYFDEEEEMDLDESGYCLSCAVKYKERFIEVQKRWLNSQKLEFGNSEQIRVLKELSDAEEELTALLTKEE